MFVVAEITKYRVPVTRPDGSAPLVVNVTPCPFENPCEADVHVHGFAALAVAATGPRAQLGNTPGGLAITNRRLGR